MLFQKLKEINPDNFRLKFMVISGSPTSTRKITITFSSPFRFFYLKIGVDFDGIYFGILAVDVGDDEWGTAVVVAFGKNDAIGLAGDFVGVGFPYDVVGGVFHVALAVFHILEFLIIGAIFVLQLAFQGFVGVAGASGEIDVYVAHHVGLGGGTRLNGDSLAGKHPL